MLSLEVETENTLNPLVDFVKILLNSVNHSKTL